MILHLREWREYRQLSVEQLASRIGVTRQTVFRWEKDQRKLTPDKIVNISKALEIERWQLWNPPSLPSVDAELMNAIRDERQMIVDIAKRILAGKK